MGENLKFVEDALKHPIRTAGEVMDWMTVASKERALAKTEATKAKTEEKTEKERIASAPQEAGKLINDMAHWKPIPTFDPAFNQGKKDLTQAIIDKSPEAKAQALSNIGIFFQQ